MNNSSSVRMPFLNSKFVPISLPAVYAPRKNLMARYDEAAKDPLIYVHAAAGCGKSLSTRLWLDTCQHHKIIWINIDQYDNNPALFYRTLSSGIFSLQPDNENMASILSSPTFSAAPVEHTIQLLAEHIWTNEPYIIVLDDMHLITNQELLRSLPMVIKRFYRSCTTIVLSRSEIPNALVPLLERPEIDEITIDDLRFTENEIRAYFNKLGHVTTAEDARFAYTITEGWALGINALSKYGNFNADNSNFLTDYFENCLWQHWDDRIKKFCICTSVVNIFDADLAKSLSGYEDTEDIIESLTQSNTFLSCLGEAKYRFHPLFHSFLYGKIDELGPDKPLLNKTAAVYYQKHGNYSAALRYWIASGDFRGIEPCLCLFMFENPHGMISDHAAFLQTFFSSNFPDVAFEQYPPLHLLYVWYAYITSQKEAFEWHLDRVYANIERITQIDSRFVEFAALAFAVDTRQPLIDKIPILDKITKHIQNFTDGGIVRNIICFTHNLPYLLRGNCDYSELSLLENGLADFEGNFSVFFGEEWPYIRQGVEACFDFERNDFQNALSKIHKAEQLFSPSNKIEGFISLKMTEYALLFHLNQTVTADAVMSELSSIVNTQAPFFLRNLEAYKCKLKLYNGDISSAREWLDQYYVSEKKHIELFRVFQEFTTAMAYIATGNNVSAERLLFLLKEFGKEYKRPLDIAESSMLLACLYWTQGDKKKALSELECALETMAPYGFIRTIATGGYSIVPVLKYLLGKIDRETYHGRLQRAYVHEVMLAAHHFSKYHRGFTYKTVINSGTTRLSKQQAKIISYLAQGYRNAEIVEITRLKLPTIKAHTSIAYKKLGVNNAMDAVLRARELGEIKD